MSSARADLWPWTSTKNFPPHGCCSLDIFLCLSRLILCEAKGGCDVAKIPVGQRQLVNRSDLQRPGTARSKSLKSLFISIPTRTSAVVVFTASAFLNALGRFTVIGWSADPNEPNKVATVYGANVTKMQHEKKVYLCLSSRFALPNKLKHSNHCMLGNASYLLPNPSKRTLDTQTLGV